MTIFKVKAYQNASYTITIKRLSDVRLEVLQTTRDLKTTFSLPTYRLFLSIFPHLC